MYICVKTNENLDKLIQEMLRNNLAIDVSRHDTLTWIDVNLKEYGYCAWVAIYAKELVVCSLTTRETLFRISFDDLETIYNLE